MLWLIEDNAVFRQTVARIVADLPDVTRVETFGSCEAALARVTCPALVVVGDRDFVFPADRLVDALPNASQRVLRNVDHFATPESFDFVDAALEFLDAIPT